MSTIAWLSLALAAAPLLLLALVCFGCWWWKQGRLAALRSASRVVLTPRGPIEYAVAGQGPPLLVIHGGMGGYDQALGLGALVNHHAGATGFTVLAPSRPGYLRTPLETGRTPEEQADALAALLDHLGIAQVGVLAGSYGGPIALQFALRHPHRLWALLLLAAVPRRCTVGQQWPVSERTLLSRPGTWCADLLHFFLYLWARNQPIGLVHFFLSRMTAPSVGAAEINRRATQLRQFPEQVRNLQQMFCSMMPTSLQLAGGLNDEKQIAALPEYPLERIQVPTLLVHGRDDCVGLGAAGAQWAAATIPGAELVLVERCGHFLLAGEFLAPVFSSVAEFLHRHAPPGCDFKPCQCVSEPLALSNSHPSREYP
jgi:pimeloyl-ACP methyl ester carboxylesterase